MSRVLMLMEGLQLALWLAGIESNHGKHFVISIWIPLFMV